jgi:hypothetical protein
MNKVIPPLRQRMEGATVADLQDALQFLLDRGLLLRSDAPARNELTPALRREREHKAFGDATAKLVAAFQTEHQLPSSGEVDERAAAATNDAISHEQHVPSDPNTPPEFQYRARPDALPGRAAHSGARRACLSPRIA